MDLYRRVVEEIATFSPQVREKEIELFHFGESLLHPKLADMVQLGSARGLKITLSVNPPHLTPARATALLAAEPYKIIVSLDGNDAATYRQIRGRAARLDRAVQHLHRLMAIYRETGSRCQLVLRAIRMYENDGQIDAMRHRWEAEGFTFEDREFFPWTESDMTGLGDYRLYPRNMPCPFPWQYMVIQWDGSVVPCCRDYDAANVMGNVRNESLRDIWNGETYRAFRRQHETGVFGSNDFCRDCTAIYCR